MKRLTYAIQAAAVLAGACALYVAWLAFQAGRYPMVMFDLMLVLANIGIFVVQIKIRKLRQRLLLRGE